MGRVNLYFTSCLKNMVRRVDPLPNALLHNSYGIVNLLMEGRVCMCKVDSSKACIGNDLSIRRNHMSECILGVDSAKRKFDVALLINGKLKHKVFTNNEEGFETAPRLASQTEC